MNVLFLSPGFPDEMNWFTEALAKQGARVFGVAEQPLQAFHERCRKSLFAYLQVRSLMDEKAVIGEILTEAKSRGIRFHRIECLWEPFMELAAKLREVFDCPGLNLEQTVPYRDKELMKAKLDAAGIRTPHHYRCTSEAECREAATKVGYPLIIKPIAGAGSADTHRCNNEREFEGALDVTRHISEVSVEEFIEGEEFTFDTISLKGKPVFTNIIWYRPRPLIARQVQWLSPQSMLLRDPEQEWVQPGHQLGVKVLEALEFETGFSHMEWFLKEDGEAVFGEIGARSPGAKTVDLMNFASDIDLYAGWAEAIVHGRFSQTITRKYNAAMIYKRANGDGRIQRIEGLQSLYQRYGEHIVLVDLLPLGARRRNWLQTLMSDGHVVVRHPDLKTCMEIADKFGTDLQLYAG